MKRIGSESRQPGMPATRQWCRPELSDQARSIGEARRAELDEIEHAKRQIENLQLLINKVWRRIK